MLILRGQRAPKKILIFWSTFSKKCLKGFFLAFFQNFDWGAEIWPKINCSENQLGRPKKMWTNFPPPPSRKSYIRPYLTHYKLNYKLKLFKSCSHGILHERNFVDINSAVHGDAFYAIYYVKSHKKEDEIPLGQNPPTLSRKSKCIHYMQNDLVFSFDSLLS